MKQALPILPVPAACFQQLERAENVGSYKLGRPKNAAVDVALRGEVHDRIGVVTREHTLDSGGIRDIDPFQTVVRRIGDRLQTVEVRRVSQLVNVDEVVFGVARNQEVQKVRPYEAGAAGDQNSHVDAL